MLDPSLLRSRLADTAARLKQTRGFDLDVAAVEELESERKRLSTETQELQRRLTSLGYDTRGIDGIVGPDSRAAVRRFQTDRGMTPDGYVSASLLQAVRAADG